MSSTVSLLIRVVWPVAFVTIIVLAVMTSLGLIPGFPAVAELVPLGIFGLYRWIMWLARKIPAAFYKPYGGDYTTSTSVIVPVFKEDPDIMRTAIESWIANRPDEIILVIDVTDEACIAIAREYPAVKVMVTDVPGKRAALADGILAATSDIVVLVDSDTIWEPTVRERLLRPFADSRIAGVGTRQNVYRPETVWQRLADAYLDIRYDDEAPAYTVMGRAVSCLSGRTAAYRRDVLVPLLGEFLNERFQGQLCMSGEDKRFTSLVLQAGYQAYHQGNAQVWSTFPADLRTALSQRVRWTRNSFRSDLRAFGQGWVLKHPYLAVMLVDRMIAPFALLVTLAYAVAALFQGQWLVFDFYVAWWLTSRAVKMEPYLHRHPKGVTLLPAYVAMTFLMAFLKIYALMTVHYHKWLTRPVEVIDGQVVRMDDASRPKSRKPPLRARATGSLTAIGLFASVQVILLAFGGAGYLPRADTRPPVVHADAPDVVAAGTPATLTAKAVDKYAKADLAYTWTLDGTYVGSSPSMILPTDLEPGGHRWAVYARDPSGNTGSDDGIVQVVSRSAGATSP